MKVLDLFSGIGGFSLGLEKAGMETVAFCEVDQWCQQVLKKHWPDILIIPDVKNIDGRKISDDIDLICGGFPCQDISIAGRKKGLKGERSGLWKEFLRVIKEVRPKWVIIENVANLRNQGLNEVLKDLWSVGYDSEWHIISARSVGACHLRERIWIIAYPNSKHIREQSRRGRGQERENQVLTGINGQDGQVADSDSKGLEGRMQASGKMGTQTQASASSFLSPDTNMPRLWKPFASKEEKSEWWTEVTASFRDWWKVESEFCRVDDGLPKGLDKIRKERIKMLGNSIVPCIAELIGKEIMKYERGTNERE